jgi:hypothetical protein
VVSECIGLTSATFLGRIKHWERLVAKEDWESVSVQGRSAKELYERLCKVLDERDDVYDATIVDVMLSTEDEYGSIIVLDKAVAEFDRRRFREIVLASSKELSDQRIQECQRTYKAIRTAAPLSKSASDVMRELRRRFDAKDRRWLEGK